MTFFYTVVHNGIETMLGTEHRGYMRKYKTLRSFMRYFMDSYAKGIYDYCVKNNLVNEYTTINIYTVNDSDRFDDTAYKLVSKVII
jgi:hypothetical protein